MGKFWHEGIRHQFIELPVRGGDIFPSPRAFVRDLVVAIDR